jgi:hypothetical protein
MPMAHASDRREVGLNPPAGLVLLSLTKIRSTRQCTGTPASPARGVPT